MAALAKLICAIFLVAAAGISTAAAAPAKMIMQEFMVPTADPGIQLYVRNKRPEGTEKFGPEKILLFVHGATYPSETAFDLSLNGL
jgi:hypothetical protein